MNKLTNEVRHSLAREHSNTQWVLPDLMAALRKEIRVLECSSQNPYKPVSNISTAAFQINAEDSKGHPATCGNTSKKKGLVCVFCKGPHPTHICESVTDHHKRLEIVKRENLLYALTILHITRCPVPVKNRCKKCKKKHIPLCATVIHIHNPQIVTRQLMRSYQYPNLQQM